MAVHTIDLLGAEGAYKWDDASDSGTGTYSDGTPICALRSTTLSIKALNIETSDTDESIKLPNGTAIRWKTSSGNNRKMLKLGSNDNFTIGSANADGADSIRFDVENTADVVVFDSVGPVAVFNCDVLVGGALEIGDIDDGLRFANNVPIKWKTTSGNYRTMLKLNTLDVFVVGNDEEDGADAIRFDIENRQGAARLQSDGFYVNFSSLANNAGISYDRHPDFRGHFPLRSGESPRWRWVFRADNDTGQEANLELEAYTLAGVLIDVPLKLERASGGSVVFGRNLLGPASWQIGVSGDANLLTLSSALLAIDGDLVGDSSFRIGPSTQTDLVELSNKLAAVRGNMTMEHGSAMTALTIGDGSTVQTKRIALNSPANDSSQSEIQFQRAGSAMWTIYRPGNTDAFRVFSHTNSADELTLTPSFGATVRLDLAVNGGDFTSTASTFNMLEANVAALNLAGAATSVRIAGTSYAVRLGSGSGSGQLSIRGGAGFFRSLTYRSSDSLRWALMTESTAESGSNAGSNLLLDRYQDNGSTSARVLEITRSNGYCYTGINRRWAVDTSGWLKRQSVDEEVTLCWYDDFDGDYEWFTACYQDSVSSTGAISLLNEVCGVVQLEGADGGGYARFFRGTSGALRTLRVNAANLPLIFTCRCKDGGSVGNSSFYIGLFDNIATRNNGVFFYQSSSNWRCVTRSGGTSTDTLTGSTTSAYRILKFEVYDTGTVRFYIDGSLAATHTSNIPAALLGIGASSESLSGGDESRFNIDFIKVTMGRG